MNIKKSEVFLSSEVFPTMWKKCLERANRQGCKYIEFNGMIFEAVDQSPEYQNSICMIEDLID